MCCIFTCCGWMIDLVQRLWTFTMSCCISSAVCCVMLTSSMSGIALGYNYSLAEYIDLKETNVSIYLKRGVFDDEIADDMDWRRSGHQPVAGHIGRENLMTGVPDEDESTTLRSGRRLDDSMFEADDKNRYEGSLMKLTAKPVYEESAAPLITDDVEMGNAVTQHDRGSLDQMKAIQSLVDSRRQMAAVSVTVTPLATYSGLDTMLQHLPMNRNPNEPGNPDANLRRVMQPGMVGPPQVNPARYAVPQLDIGSRVNWLAPKNPAMVRTDTLPEVYVYSPTYPQPVTIRPDLERPTRPPMTDAHPEAIMFVTRTISVTRTSTKTSALEKLARESEAFNEQFLLEGDTPSQRDFLKMSKSGKSSEEEYEDEIKGLPVRRRRSIKFTRVKDAAINTTINNVTYLHNSTNNDTSAEISISLEVDSTTYNLTSDNIKKNLTNQENLNVLEKEIDMNQQIDIVENPKSDPEDKAITDKENVSAKKQEKTLIDRLIAITENKLSNLITETIDKANDIFEKMGKPQKKRDSFESKIVSSKYLPNNNPRLLDTMMPKMDNAELLNSISINLNDEGLLRNPKSSSFIKLLQSTLT